MCSPLSPPRPWLQVSARPSTGGQGRDPAQSRCSAHRTSGCGLALSHSKWAAPEYGTVSAVLGTCLV